VAPLSGSSSSAANSGHLDGVPTLVGSAGSSAGSMHMLPAAMLPLPLVHMLPQSPSLRPTPPTSGSPHIKPLLRGTVPGPVWFADRVALALSVNLLRLLLPLRFADKDGRPYSDAAAEALASRSNYSNIRSGELEYVKGSSVHAWGCPAALTTRVPFILCFLALASWATATRRPWRRA